MQDKILLVLKEFEQKIRDSSIFFCPEIPEKKMLNAIQKYAPSVELGDILVLVDDTVFGSANEGVLITKDVIYSNRLMEKLIKFELNKIKNVAFVGGMMSQKIYINDIMVIDTTQPSKGSMQLVAELIREIAGLYGNPGAATGTSGIQDALVKLKSLYDAELITKEEYDEKRKGYVSQL